MGVRCGSSKGRSSTTVQAPLRPRSLSSVISRTFSYTSSTSRRVPRQFNP